MSVLCCAVDGGGQACVIVAQYVKPLSPLEANMPDARRASLAATVKSGSAPRNLFEGEKAAAFKDMMRDTLPRFVKDPLYREAVKLSTQAVVHASKRYEDCLTVRGVKRYVCRVCLCVCLVDCLTCRVTAWYRGCGSANFLA